MSFNFVASSRWALASAAVAFAAAIISSFSFSFCCLSSSSVGPSRLLYQNTSTSFIQGPNNDHAAILEIHRKRNAQGTKKKATPSAKDPADSQKE
eukprot:CAMPEP_0113528228 /NCGR_PEP_ID=MMETSP0015_2-20120614/1729_1 /TAXON_ID=2838 /ORGANISM="Odontella" /LENGTH=94 /DNA_ID=CAMNT_0000426739 /DNA_START=305 /DNA_END=592 /DNA_ORIENTATION=+ /assembly_acc=CAM_ASM_000160